MGPFGSDIKISNFTSSGVPVLNGANVRAIRVTDDFENFVTPDKAKSLKKAIARRGDIVVTHRGTLGQIAYIGADSAFDRYVISQSQFRVRLRSDVATSEWVVLYFHSERGAQVLLEGKGHTGVPAISSPTTTFRKFLLPTPPLAEQSAIATALGDLDRLIAAQDALIAKKRAIKQGAMQELLTGKRRLPGFSGEWEVKRLGEIAQLSKVGINPSETPEELFTHFSLPAFDAGERPVVESGASIGSNKFVVPQAAVLLSKLNPRIPRVWAPTEVPENSVCSTEFLVLLPREFVERDFFLYLCRSNLVSAQMELHAIGTTGSHQRIHPNQALAIEVIVPVNAKEQLAIAGLLSDMDSELAVLEAQRAKTGLIKQSMMQELLTGRIRLI